MKFSEFHAGQVIQAGPYLITEKEVVRFATAYDPQWFHTDLAAAQQGPFGGFITSGWHTCATAKRFVADAALHDSESYASPGLGYIKWPHPVRPGDSLSLKVTVPDTRRSRSQPNLGIVKWRWQMITATSQDVLDLEATTLFNLTPKPS